MKLGLLCLQKLNSQRVFFVFTQKINSFRFVIYLKNRKKIFIFTRAACDNTVIFKKKEQAED